MLACVMCGGIVELGALSLVGAASVIVPYVRDSMILKRHQRAADELNRRLAAYPLEAIGRGTIARKELASRVAEQSAS